jgi:hypothetical protein
MPETTPNQDSISQENLDYQRALGVMYEARLNALGALAIEEAEGATYESGVASPAFVLEEAEMIKKMSGVASEAEEYLEGGIAAQAQDYLKVQAEEANRKAEVSSMIKEHGLAYAIEELGKTDFASFRRQYKPKGYTELFED